MATVTVDCPFCHTNNDPSTTGGYCDTCGRRLPVSSAYMHTTKKARRAGGDEAAPGEGRQARGQTAESLLTAMVLRLVLGGGFFVVGPVFFKTLPDFFLTAVMAFTAGGAAFFGLTALLARSQPFPAAVIALVGLIAAWAVVLSQFLAAASLAGVDVILFVWLARTVWISRDDRP